MSCPNCGNQSCNNQNYKCERDYSCDYSYEDNYNDYIYDDYNDDEDYSQYKCCKYYDEDRCNCKCNCECNGGYEIKSHVHEFESSVKLAEKCEDRHNHRVACVTGDAIPTKSGSHVHEVMAYTDNLDHFHKIWMTTGPAIKIEGTNKHVHLIKGFTSFDDCHCHAFLFTTQIQAPLV